jgi:hypothetical protein
VPRLVVFRGDAVESEIRLAGGPVRVGRHARNDVVLDDSLNGVSRFHAEIRPEGNGYVIVDLNSRNGVWIAGRRIKDKAVLSLGVPVTVGAFELALEDDASGTFDGRVPSSRTVVSAGALGDTGSRSAATAAPGRTGATASPARPPAAARTSPQMSAATRQILLWSAAAAVVILICGITYAVVRYRTRPEPVVAEAPPAVTTPAPVAETAPPTPPEDPNKALNEQDLAAAREMIAANNYAAAVREHLQPLLERDPENTTALELKRQADEAIDAAAAKPRNRPAPKAETTAEVETAGIARKAGEAFPEYTARVRQIQANLAEGKAALEKPEYAVALARFRLVDRDAPKFQGVDALIADTVARQQKVVDSAIDSGQQNEGAGKLMDARRWYDVALQQNPSSSIAREKRTAVAARMNAAAAVLFNQGTAALKIQNNTLAKQLFQQVYEQTMPGDEYREKATKQLELLK